MTAICWKLVCNLTKIITCNYFFLYLEHLLYKINDRCCGQILSQKMKCLLNREIGLRKREIDT